MKARKRKSLESLKRQTRLNHSKKVVKRNDSRTRSEFQPQRVFSFPVGTKSLSAAKESFKLAAFIGVPCYLLRARFSELSEFYERVEELWVIVARELGRT